MSERLNHKIHPMLDACEVCNLSTEAMRAKSPKLDFCPGHKLVVDERGFPVPIGTVTSVEANPLTCAECGNPLTTADADHLVSTDAGPVHRECFEGPMPPGSETSIDELELAAENERRRDHGEPELTSWPNVINADDKSQRQHEQMIREDLANPLDPDRRF